MPSSSASLPHVDEHSVEIHASSEQAWDALLRTVDGSFSSPATARAARLLGCADSDVGGPRPLATGSSFPGFHVESADPPNQLVLTGGHRFSDYALIFRSEELAGDRTRLRAETRARFPGIDGRVYRTLVIGTRIHVLVTRRLLGAIGRRAERARTAEEARGR